MKRKKQKVLVYPCGTEMALEIYKAVEYSTCFELWGGSGNRDHGEYVYRRYIGDLPFITDKSEKNDILEFQDKIKKYNIDFIYPAMDGVLFKFSQFASFFTCKIITPDFDTAAVTRSKKLTYMMFEKYVAVPKVFKSAEEIYEYPVFIKPDVGQGSAGAQKIDNVQILNAATLDGMLLLEYLPGKEYTVDCFTNNSGKLIYISPRDRKRIKNGISVCSHAAEGTEFKEIAIIINEKLNQRGGWFFQVKRNNRGKLVLLEVASRIAGTSAYTRSKGVNLPLLTLYLYSGNEIEKVYENKYDIIIDRALSNSYATNLHYEMVYLDYDDTLIFDGKVNVRLIAFLYQCINNKIPVVLLTKHIGNLTEDLRKNRLYHLFDKVISLKPEESKYKYIKNKNAIFIDDSFGERKAVYEKLDIPAFDTHMIEFLIDPLEI